MTTRSPHFECLRPTSWFAAPARCATLKSFAALDHSWANHNLVTVPMRTRTDSRLVRRHEVATPGAATIPIEKRCGTDCLTEMVIADVRDGARWLTTDIAKVRTILRNLAHNAIKFTSDGEISVRVEHRDGELRFALRDTGIGIAREDREKIFEPFRQLDGSVTSSRGGVGLGLALSRRLARLLGGDIEVDGKPGSGSTFTLRLPAGDKDETARMRSGRGGRYGTTHAESEPTLAA